MKLGFIGTGNMAEAIIEGAVRGGVLAGADILLDSHRSRAQSLHERLGVSLCPGLKDMLHTSDALILAVKPHVVGQVLAEAGDSLKGKALLSVAAGWSHEMLEKAAPGARVLRTMPNTPALVGAGMTALSKAHTLTEAEAAWAEKLFSSFGRIVWVEERLMEAVIGVSGSGPAYGFLFIEAMADAGVLEGLPRPMALELAAQTLLGAAKMALSGGHPAEWKDKVCSPGGTTIAAIHALEKAGFRGAVMDAVIAAADRAQAMKG